MLPQMAFSLPHRSGVCVKRMPTWTSCHFIIIFNLLFKKRKVAKVLSIPALMLIESDQGKETKG